MKLLILLFVIIGLIVATIAAFNYLGYIGAGIVILIGALVISKGVR